MISNFRQASTNQELNVCQWIYTSRLAGLQGMCSKGVEPECSRDSGIHLLSFPVARKGVGEVKTLDWLTQYFPSAFPFSILRQDTLDFYHCVDPSVCLSGCILRACLPVSVCPSVYLFVCVCLYVCLSVLQPAPPVPLPSLRTRACQPDTMKSHYLLSALE